MKLCDLQKLEHSRITVFLRNLAFDVINKKLDLDKFNEFKGLLANVAEAAGLDPTNINASLSAAGAREKFSNIVSEVLETGDFTFKGSEIPFDNSMKVTRLISVVDFMQFNVDSIGVSPILYEINSVSDAEYAARRLLTDTELRQLDLTSKISSPNGYIWVSDHSYLDDDAKSNVELLRSKLGLEAYDNEESLIMITINGDALSDLRSPTGLDGGVGFVYWSSGQKGEWGYTLNLETLEEGMPEALTSGIEVKKEHNYDLIGRLSTDKPATDLTALRERAEADLLSYESSAYSHCFLCSSW